MKTLKALMIAAALMMLAGAAWARPTILWLESVSHDCTFAPDDTIRMQIRLDSIDAPYDSIGMAVNYFVVPLEFIRAERGPLISGWSKFNFAVGNGPGPDLKRITIDASDSTPITTGISGYLATLVFVAKDCTSSLHYQLCWAQTYADFTNIDARCGYIDVVPRAAPGRLSVESLYHTCSNAAGDTIAVDVRVEESTSAIDAAGVDIPYDSGQLQYVGFKRGDLTAAWPFFDVALLPQRIRVGGFTTTSIPGGSTGVFVTLRFIMHCCGTATLTQLCMESLVDDFAGMTTGCGTLRCSALATQPSTWGYVKSLYR